MVVTTILLPHSGKFSLVQNFAEMCPDSSEEIGNFLKFLQKQVCPRKSQKFAPSENFPLYGISQGDRSLTNLKSPCIRLKLHRGATQHNVHDKSWKHPHNCFALHGVMRCESWGGECYTDGFHGVWLHFRRARVGVCIWCGCVQNTGKEVLY